MKNVFAIGLLCALGTCAQSPAQDPLNPSLRPSLNSSPAAYPNNIWITGPLVKVLRNAGMPGPDHSVIIYASKNEFQAFQVHVHAGATPVNALDVSMSDLVNSRTGGRISASSTDIVVYREAYENVTIKTATGATFLNTTGEIPDILIPAVDPYYHQRTRAFPFRVAPGTNQSAWIDVHVPPSAPSGFYSGTVTVKDGAAVLAALPVIYGIWDWEMPSTASLASFTAIGYGGFCIQAYGPSAGCRAYPGAEGAADYGVTLSQVDAAVQLLDNRYSLGGLTNVYPGAGSFASFDKIYGPLLKGTPAHTTGILRGARLTSWNIGLLGNQFTAEVFQNFQKHFAQNGWVAPFFSLADEPNKDEPSIWKTLIEKGRQVHAFSEVPTMVTTDLANARKFGATDAIDYLIVLLVSLEPGAGTPMQDLAAYRQWAAGSPKRHFWSYTSCSNTGTCNNGHVGPEYKGYPNTFPNYVVDGTPVANRAMEWMTFLHGQTGELYYYVDVCDYATGLSYSCGVGAPGVTKSPGNPLISNYYAGGWGDGTLIYPGSSEYVGAKIPIWLPSLRLKMIRDGMQDYEYLNALAKLGEGAFSIQQVRSFITNSYTFDNNPAGLESARLALGNRLHQLMLSPTRGRGQKGR